MSLFICDVCHKEFKSKQALGGHKSSAHKTGSRYAVKRKLKKTKNKSIFECKFCKRQTTNAGANKKHENSCLENPNPAKHLVSSSGRKSGYKSTNQYIKAKELGLDKPVVSISTRKKLSQVNVGRKHSRDTKDKISKSRRKYLSDNPDMVPYKLNHYSKGPSYPERYWKKIFDKVGLVYDEQYQIHTYQLDFALVEEKIDIEIDGEQHYLDERIIKSDKRRNEYLENLGWKVIRIRWSEYKKLVDKQDKIDYINSILKEIGANTQVDKEN